MPTGRCTTCGSQLTAYSICPHCGSLIGVENAVRRVRGLIHARVARAQKHFPHRLSTLQFLWICALIPLAIVPPVLSLLASVKLMGRPAAARWDNQLEWIITIAAINLLLSVLVLSRFHFSPSELASYLRGSIFLPILDMIPNVPDRGPFPQTPDQAMPI